MTTSVGHVVALLVGACVMHSCSALAVPLSAAARTPAAAARVAARPSMLFGGGGKEGEGGGMNIMETMKKAQEVGVKVKALQEELLQTEIEAVAADGGVTVVISGAQVPLSVSVTPELLAQGANAVSEAVSIAAKEAHTNSVRGWLQPANAPPRAPVLPRATAHALPVGLARCADCPQLEYAKDRMSALYGDIGLPMPPQQ